MMSPRRGAGESHLSYQRRVKYYQRHNSIASTRHRSEKPHSGFRCRSLPCPLEPERSSPIPEYSANGIFLAARNDTVTESNNTWFASIPGELFISRGVDRVVEVVSKYFNISHRISQYSQHFLMSGRLRSAPLSSYCVTCIPHLTYAVEHVCVSNNVGKISLSIRFW